MVTNQHLIIVHLTLRCTVELVISTDEAVVNERSVLALRITLCSAVRGQQCRVILQLDFIVSIGIVGVGPETHTILQHFVETKFKFETIVHDFTLIDIRGRCSTIIRRYRTVVTRYEDVITFVTEPVETTCEHTTEESIVETDVHFSYCCPTKIWSSNDRFLITLIWTLTSCQRHIYFIQYRPLSQVSPTCTGIVITDFTV